MRKLYQNVDVVMIPSVTVSGTQENTSIAALEAMACGTPVIASNIGGLPELIRDGHNGFLIPERNSPALADATLTLLEDMHLAQRMGRDARRRAVHDFSVPLWTERVMEAYYIALDMRKIVTPPEVG